MSEQKSEPTAHQSSRLSPARRETIMAIAWDAFLEKGYSDTSMADVSERLGGSKATLYNYFRSKEELFLAVMRQKQAELYAELKYLPEQLNDLPKELTDYGCRLLEIVLTEKYLAIQRFGIVESARFTMVTPEEYDKRRREVLEPLSERLQDQMKAGRLVVSDPVEASEVFWNLCSASIYRRMLMTTAPSYSKREIRRIVSRAVAIFLAAFGAPEGKGRSG